MKRLKTYKGFVIAAGKCEQTNESFYYVFLKDEWAYGPGYRTEEIQAGTLQEAQDFIECY
ncbi:MAG: hypothetical protein SCK57_08810 [Bacillota bacterium]|nr:hypothetical protein [Bacillota bacterium]